MKGLIEECKQREVEQSGLLFKLKDKDKRIRELTKELAKQKDRSSQVESLMRENEYLKEQ